MVTILIVTSCTQVDTDSSVIIPSSTELRAIVVSEGQFGYGTGSLTTVTHDQQVTQDVFKKINNRVLGDIPQSLTQIGDNYYIPVNNSRKIEVIDSKSFKTVETMVLNTQIIPMYVEHLGGDSIIVSDQSSSAIPGSSEFSSLMILDINHGTDRQIIRRRIKMNFPTFQMKLIGKKLFVSGAELSVFDLDNLNASARRFVKNAENKPFSICDFSKICIDKRGLIWALTPGSVVCIDPNTEKIINEYFVDGLSSRWGNSDIDKDGRYFYFNSGTKVYSIDTDNPSTPSKPIINHNNNDPEWTTYALGVTKENTVMIVRVLFGSITRGRVFEYDRSGNIVKYYLDSEGRNQPYFRAGIFPHYIHFL